ncbi:MAG: amino acid adenylation domain-containing protein [Pseudomonadota bacterium]
MNAQLDSTPLALAATPTPHTSDTPNAPQDVYPLTPTQQGMLFHALQSPGQGVYVIQTRFDLKGPFDQHAFEAAWQAVGLRHDVLRTAFAWDGLARPLQIVGPRAAIPVAFHEAATAQEISATLEQDRRQGFDLRQAPLLRVQVWRQSAEHHHVLLTHHHILLDGWSMPLLLADWRLAYQALAQGLQPAWPQPAPRFRAHLLWLRQQSAEAARAFWQAELAGLSATSTPAWVRPARVDEHHQKDPSTDQRVDTKAHTPHVLEAVIPPGTLQSIEAAARGLRVTLSTAVLGAWMLLMSRHSGARDVVAGLTRSGRPMSQPEAARTLGMYITTLPVRSPIRAAQSLGAWLQSLQARQAAQGPHEHLPLTDVRRCAEAMPALLPLHDSIVVFENYPMPPTGAQAKAPGMAPHASLRVEQAQVVEQTHYALSLYALPCTEGLHLKLLADPQRVAMTDAGALMDQLAHLLSGLPTQLNTPLGSLHTLTDTQWRKMMDAGAAPTPHHAPWPLPPQRIAASLAQRAGQVVMQDATGQLSGDALAQRVQHIALLLQEHGVRHGDHVGIGLARHRDLVAATLACWHLGAAYVPMDPGFPADRLRLIASDAAVRAVLVENKTRAVFDQGFEHVLDIGLADAWTNEQLNRLAPAHATHPDDTAYLLHTSGSTGRPKGVPVRHRSLGNLLQSMAERIGPAAPDPWLAVTTLSFDIAGLELFLPLSMGSVLLLADEAQARDPEQLIPMLVAQPRCVMQATPATWRLLVHAGWPGHSGLTVLCGGEALERPLAEALLPRCAALWNVYGPTETTIWSAALRIDQALLARHPDAAAMPVGQALLYTTLRVLDDAGLPVPHGVPGELCIGGTGLSQGYHRQPRLSAERFVPDPFAQDQAGALYRTGDSACWQHDGTLAFLGRLDHQVKLRGHRIELGEIEAALLAQPEVAQAIAVVHGDGAQARLLAFVAWRDAGDNRHGQPSATTDAAAVLMPRLAERLPAYMMPAAIHVPTHWPLTPNGKIDRRALRPPSPTEDDGAQATQSALDIAAEMAAQTPLVHTLLQLWRELLQRTDIGLDDHFFEVGGHSLLLVTLQGQIKKRLGRELALTELFQHPTVRRLAAHLDRAQAPMPALSGEAATKAQDTAAHGRSRLQARQARLRQGTAGT